MNSAWQVEGCEETTIAQVVRRLVEIGLRRSLPDCRF